MWETIGLVVSLIISPILVLIMDRRAEQRVKAERILAERENEEINVRINKKDIDTQDAVKALLRAHLVDRYHNAMIDGYVDIFNRDVIDRMYVEYKNLGGNSVIDDLMVKLMQLPTVSEEELEDMREEDRKQKRR